MIRPADRVTLPVSGPVSLRARVYLRVLEADVERGPPLVPEFVRPRTRADCLEGPRPCPWEGCRHNLALEINPQSQSVTVNFPDTGTAEEPPYRESCSLDMAERGGLTLEEVGAALNLTSQRTREIEQKALAKFQRKMTEK